MIRRLQSVEGEPGNAPRKLIISLRLAIVLNVLRCVAAARGEQNAALVVSNVTPFVAKAALGMWGMEARLCDKGVSETVARRLAAYCQSDRELIPRTLDYAWLPPEIDTVAPGVGYCVMGTNGANVEFGGGFHHFGYALRQDPINSSASTNCWQIFLFRDGGTNTPLATVFLPITRRLDRNEIKKFVESGYDREIIRGYLDAYRGKMETALRFGTVEEAVAISRKWIGSCPEDWLPRLAYAHLRCRSGEADRASADFGEWVDLHPTFANYSYLTLFEFRERRSKDAVNAIRKLVKQPYVEVLGQKGSKFYLGFGCANIAYSVGEYRLCLTLCDMMLADDRVRDWLKAETLVLKAAAIFMTLSPADATVLLRNADPRQLISQRDDNAFKRRQELLDAFERHDVEYVKDLRHIANTTDRWFDPFDDEGASVGGPPWRALHIYPESWKSNKLLDYNISGFGHE